MHVDMFIAYVVELINRLDVKMVVIALCNRNNGY